MIEAEYKPGITIAEVQCQDVDEDEGTVTFWYTYKQDLAVTAYHDAQKAQQRIAAKSDADDETIAKRRRKQGDEQRCITTGLYKQIYKNVDLTEESVQTKGIAALETELEQAQATIDDANVKAHKIEIRRKVKSRVKRVRSHQANESNMNNMIEMMEAQKKQNEASFLEFHESFNEKFQPIEEDKNAK